PSHRPPSEHVPNDPTPSTPPNGDAPGGRTARPPAPPAHAHPHTTEELTAAEVRRAAAILLVAAVAGIALGLLWLWLAPRVPLVSDGESVLLKESEAEHAVGADGVFVLLGLAFGALGALAVFLRHRQGGIAVVVGLALGGLLGSALAWGTGTLLGPTHDVVARARAVGEGVVFDAPLELHAYGALLAWPAAAMAVHLALTALFGPRDPEPGEWGPGPYGPPPPPREDPRA
ncbi:ABC transporter permease, partial [Streptomyces somaliensis DSM 40738]